MKKILTILLFTCFIFSAYHFSTIGNVYVSNAGSVKFATKGPLGNILAESKQLTGSLDADKKVFAFTMPITSFEGFQNSLQKKHFNEKYMESAKIPMASFKGKIIEDVNLAIAGVYSVRAKGSMKIHDVEKEMIIKSKITVKAGLMSVESSFNILLEDFSIKIPTIASQKVDEDVAVAVKMDLTPKK